MNWAELQDKIDQCRVCEQESIPYLTVPRKNKRHPPAPPIQPVRLFFISVAPPWGGAYFWDEVENDELRKGLFEALNQETAEHIFRCSQFREAGFFLVPGVKCPSQSEKKDHRPSANAIHNCASFLRMELENASPERVLALGRSAFQSVAKAFGLKIPKAVKNYRRSIFMAPIGDRLVPISGTYFAGNNRHQGFQSIVDDINWILEKEPQPLRRKELKE